jgi:hypothetical protein
MPEYEHTESEPHKDHHYLPTNKSNPDANKNQSSNLRGRWKRASPPSKQPAGQQSSFRPQAIQKTEKPQDTKLDNLENSPEITEKPQETTPEVRQNSRTPESSYQRHQGPRERNHQYAREKYVKSDRPETSEREEKNIYTPKSQDSTKSYTQNKYSTNSKPKAKGILGKFLALLSSFFGSKPTQPSTPDTERRSDSSDNRHRNFRRNHHSRGRFQHRHKR